MKQEAGKKNKKWLWLAISLAALLVVAGVVLALVLPGLGGSNEELPGRADLYWNVDRLLYTENAEVAGFSNREPAEDGNFYVRFAHDAQQVELQVIDKQLVNVIDNMDVMGLVFDADGVVIDAVAADTLATKTAGDFYVRELKEGKAVLNSSIAMNGMEIQIDITEEADIYDVTPEAEMVGQYGELDIFQRVLVYSNANDVVTHVYITENPVDADIYWRVERCYDTTVGYTTREPDENGVFTMEFSHKGEVVELKCRDEKLVNEIDTNGLLQGQFALVFDEEGYIVDTVDVGMALRGTYFASDYHVTEMNGDTVTLTKLSPGSEQGNVKTVTLSEDIQIFQCCQFKCYDHNCGEIVDSLRLHDRLNIYTDLEGKAIMAFVTRRTVDSRMYYNFDPKYGGEAKGSTREKQNGYYVFELLVDGKVETFKTKDKAIADAIDGRSNRCSGLELDGNIITRVYDPACVFGGIALGNRSPLSAMMGSVITVSDPYSGGSWNAVLAADCKIYNAITGVYGKAIGGESDLQVGDMVTTFRNYKEEICLVLVTSRPVQGAKVYYNLERMYNAEDKVTRREPNEEGYYEYLMACEGKQVRVKTKDKGMATFIDSQNAPLVGMKVNKQGIVTNAYEVTIALQGATKTCNYHYVENVNQKTRTFSTYYLEDGQRKNSSIPFQTMAKNCKIYNVSMAYKDYRGEVATLKDGDQIQGIMDIVTGEISMIFIMNRDPIAGFESYDAYCDHCGKTVTWEPYAGGLYVEKDTHYYACSEYVLRQGIIGREDDGKTYDVVIDLKGKTVRGMGRVFLVYDKLTIVDSVGGGKVMGTTPSGDTATNGSTIMVLNGGELNLQAGELTLSDKSTQYGTTGGVLFVGGKAVVNMTGGKISGGITEGRGGNVFIGGTFNMSGGTISGGTATAGENIFVDDGGKLNISGGTIDGGIYTIVTGKITLSGAPVISGTGLKIPSGVQISVAGLTSGASIVVDGDGVFTEDLTNPETYLAYFKAARKEDSIEVKGKALNYIKVRVNYNNVDNSNLSFAAGTTNSLCPVCNKTVTWTALSTGANALDGGHYYLDADITYSGTEAAFITGPGVAKTACVHLNGHNITATANRAIEAKAGTLNMIGNGTVSGSYNENKLFGATLNVNGSDGTLNLIGGTYTKSEACNVSSVLLIRNGNANMYSGAQIVGANDSGKCANVSVFTNSFNLYGGKISGGSGNQINSYNWSKTASGIVNIHGGEIVGTVLVSGADTKRGTFTMDGGTVTGYVNLGRFVDSTISGGKVDGTVNIDIVATNENSTFVVSGAPIITGNGLVVPRDYKISLGTLTSGASIKVQANGVFTEKLADANGVKGYFVPAGKLDVIEVVDSALSYTKKQEDQNDVDNGNLNFTSGTNAVCPACNKEVTWTALSATDANALSGGHYYLDADVTYSGSEAAYITGPGAGLTACVHLNGHNITATANHVIEGKAGTVNMMGTGTVSGSYNANRLFGATINMNGQDGTLNLIGGTYTKSAACNVSSVVLIRNGNVNMFEGAEIVGANDSGKCANVTVFTNSFNLYGGKISGGSGNQIASNNWSATASGILNIHGGEVVGTVAVSGAETKHGVFTMDGGTINGYVNVRWHMDVAITGGTINGTLNIDKVATNANSFVALSGNPVIAGTGLVIPTDYKITLGELTSGASILVSANGVFTEALTNADAAKAYFTAAGANDNIQVEGNALSYVKGKKDMNTVDNSDLAFTSGTNAVCPTCGGKEVTWTALSTDSANILEGGKHYYLTGDVTYTGSEAAYITGPGSGVTACVHLNGHNITATAYRVIEGKEGTLNIMGNGTLTGNYNAHQLFGATVNMNGVDGTLNLIGGTYTKGEACNTSSVLLIRSGDVNMYNGAQIANVNSVVNVKVFTNSFNLYGGKLSGGTGYQIGSYNWSANVSGIVNIYGGEVEGTVMVSGAETKHGTFTMEGGTINGLLTLSRFVDSAIIGGTVNGTVNIPTTATNDNSFVAISGNPVITGTGLVIPEGYKITLGELKAEASIKLTATGVFTEALANDEAAEAAKTYFIPADDHEIVVEGGALACKNKGSGTEPSEPTEPSDPTEPSQPEEPAFVLDQDGDGYAECPVCKQNVQWTAVTDALGANCVTGGHYYLAADVTTPYQFITNVSKTVCLHLNNKNLTYASRMFVAGAGAVLNIMGDGTVTSNGSGGTLTGTITTNGGIVNLYGGTYSSTAQGLPVLKIMSASSQINVYQGVTVNAASGIASVDAEKGTFTMNGGKVSGGVKLTEATMNLDGSSTIDLINVAATAKLVVKADYTGTASASFAALADNTIPEANGVSEGNYTGKLTLGTPDGAKILGKEGKLVIEATTTNPEVLKGQQITAAANAMTFPTDKTESTQKCPVCDQEVTWKPASGQIGNINDGNHHHYYLTQKITSQWQFITQTSGNVCLHMNGFDVDVESRIFTAGTTMNIMGNGAITCLGNSGTQTGTLSVNNSTVNLYGCTIASVAQGGTPAIYLNGNSSVVNVYAGATVGGAEGTSKGTNVLLEKGTFNMYGGTVQNGAGFMESSLRQGGNIYMYSGTTLNMYTGTVTGGAADLGGNIRANGATVNIYEDAVISDGETTSHGGNMHLIGACAVTTSGKITGGKTTGAGHGGNISIADGCVLTIAGGEITGGIAAGQGGNIRCWNATLTMTDGVVSGGSATTGTNHNVWAAGTTTMTMLGGTVKGTNGTTANGTGIFLSQTAVLYLGGDATVTRDDGINLGNVYATYDSNATVYAAVRVLNDWTGTASVKWKTEYANGATVDADRGGCGTLTESTFVAGGTYAGTLVYELDQTCVVVGEDGALKIATAG